MACCIKKFCESLDEKELISALLSHLTYLIAAGGAAVLDGGSLSGGVVHNGGEGAWASRDNVVAGD